MFCCLHLKRQKSDVNLDVCALLKVYIWEGEPVVMWSAARARTLGDGCTGVCVESWIMELDYAL